MYLYDLLVYLIVFRELDCRFKPRHLVNAQEDKRCADIFPQFWLPCGQ